MNYYLVDYENIKLKEINQLKSIITGDLIAFFYSENCKNISFDLIEQITRANIHLRFYKIETGHKNALDFQLVSQLGYFIREGGQTSKYYIVSNDTDYDCISKYWKKYNIKVTIQHFDKNNNIVTEDNGASLEEIKQYLTEDDNPEEILEIFNQHKLKNEIHTTLQIKFKDGKKVSMIYKKLKELFKKYNKL